jgi:hypothetical protein
MKKNIENNIENNKYCERKIIHSIKNFKKLDNLMIKDMENMEKKNLLKIIYAYNNIMDYINEIIEKM